MSNSFLWLIALPLLASPIIYLAGRIPLRRAAFHTVTLDGQLALETPKSQLPVGIAMAALLAAWVPLIAAVNELSASGATSFTLGAITLRLDGLSLLLAVVALGLGTVVVLFS